MNVRVNVEELKCKLLANRANHQKKVDIAWRGYNNAAIKLLNDQLEALKFNTRFKVEFNETAPDDHTTDYDRIIGMLNMSADKVIELTEKQFNQYVFDEWDWKGHWEFNNSKYLH